MASTFESNKQKTDQAMDPSKEPPAPRPSEHELSSSPAPVPHYGTREATSPQLPSGGWGLSRKINNTGKVNAGQHRGSILAVTRRESSVVLILESKPQDLCHSEVITWLPPEWTQGLAVDFEVGFTDGFLVGQSGGKYKATCAESGTEIHGWSTNLIELVNWLTRAGWHPASTKLLSITSKELGTYVPVLHAPKARKPSPPAT